jgi:methylated-DNA-protein-cysteine methyltransferase related protein
VKAEETGLYERIWRVVERIPEGRVATYGQIARLARIGNSPRTVGYALHSLPDGLPIPWHRVVNAAGMISFPAGSTSHARQKRLLEAEGIMFRGKKTDLEERRWEPGAGLKKRGAWGKRPAGKRNKGSREKDER